MIGLPDDHNSRGERTLLTALLLSSPGPIVTGLSAFLSCSATLIADFLRRSTELAAVFASWRIYRKLRRCEDVDAADEAACGNVCVENEKARLERLAGLYVGGAMGLSGVIMLFVAVLRSLTYSQGGHVSGNVSGNVTMGLVIAMLGLITNTWFWLRYRSLAKERPDCVMEGQRKLYLAKSCVDLCVVLALTAVQFGPVGPAAVYVDISGALLVSAYLLWNAIRTIAGKS